MYVIWFKGIDLVNDNPENALLREVAQIRNSQKMKKTLDEVNHQIAMNEGSKRQLQTDLSRKDRARNIDDEARQVN